VSVRALVLGLAVLAPAPESAPEPPQAAATLQDVEPAVVQIVTIRGDGETRIPRGSAFYVNARGHLLTCAHVIDHLPGDEAARLRLRDGSERRFEIVAVDREVDVAILRAAPSARFLALGSDLLPRPGETVILAGYTVRASAEGGAPRFLPGTITGLERRRISGVRRAVGSRRTILTVRVDTIAEAGQSGGPLVDADTNPAVGIIRANLERVTGGLDRARPEGDAVAVPLIYVLPLVRRYAD